MKNCAGCGAPPEGCRCAYCGRRRTSPRRVPVGIGKYATQAQMNAGHLAAIGRLSAMKDQQSGTYGVGGVGIMGALGGLFR